MKSRQEQQLKVRYFLPPNSVEPEMFILDQDGAGSFFGPDNPMADSSKIFRREEEGGGGYESHLAWEIP